MRVDFRISSLFHLRPSGSSVVGIVLPILLAPEIGFAVAAILKFELPVS
jgi:hypothetical protein